jgi:hypothetical protein
VGEPASVSTARASFTSRDAAPPEIRCRSRNKASVLVAPIAAATCSVSTCRTNASWIPVACWITVWISST